MHEYKFDEIEDDDNPGGNSKQTKTQDATAKKNSNRTHSNTKSNSESKDGGNPEYQ